MNRIIVYPGLFDPIHNGHLDVARLAAMTLDADVLFLPLGKFGKAIPVASAKDREAMLRLALKKDGSPSFSADYSYISSTRGAIFEKIASLARRRHKDEILLFLNGSHIEDFPHIDRVKDIAAKATIVYLPVEGMPARDDILSAYDMVRLPVDATKRVTSSGIRSLKHLDCPMFVLEYIAEHSLYYMDTLSKVLSEGRLAHSCSVASVCYGIAIKNKFPEPKKAYIAGLLHDLGKDLSKQKERSIMAENYPDKLSMPRWTYHQFTGAFLAKTLFEIEDKDILDAIACHATGKAHMTPLAKALYASDKIEPTRGYDSSKMIRACLKNYYVGFLYVLKENRIYLESKGYTVDNPMTAECFDLYLDNEEE